jgi:hypothetical protein
VRDEGQFLEGVGIGEMPQVVEKSGAQERTYSLGAEPGIGPLFRQVDEKPPGQVVHSQRVGCPGMGGAGVNLISRAKLKDPGEPRERNGADQGCHGRGKVNMTPKNISNRVRIPFPEGCPCIIVHNIRILPSSAKAVYRGCPKLKFRESLYSPLFAFSVIKSYYNVIMKKKLMNRHLYHYIPMGILMGALILVWPDVSLFPQETDPGETSGELIEAIEPIEAVNMGTVIPQQIRRPVGREDPRYPRDAIIGELGQGLAPGTAYSFARELLSALLGGTTDSAVLNSVSSSMREEITGVLEAINAKKYRIGGGHEEDDGAISFLFRFIGREQGVAGELYLRKEEEAWQADDIIIEKPQDILDGRKAYPYDFTPYERFF